MGLGSNIYKLTFDSNARTALTPTRREIALSKKIMEETRSATERYGDSLDVLNQQLNKDLITTKDYNRAVEQLRRETKESDPAWQRQNELQQQAIKIKNELRSAEQRALGPMREARELRKAGLLTDQQYHDRLAQIKSTLPSVVAAEKRLADERKRAEQITRQNMTAEERYKQSVRDLPRVLLTTKTGVETYRREVVRLRNEYLSTIPVQRTFASSLMGSFTRFAGPLASITGVSLGIGGLGMAARSGLRSYNEFATGMARSTSIMGDLSQDQLTRMRDTARDVSFDVEASAGQAAEAYYFLASAGLDAESSIASMPLVAKFAQAGTFDLSLATDLLTDAQSALGLNVGTTSEKLEGMAEIADVLTLAAIKSNATIEQFSTSLTTKAGTALKSYSKDLEEGVSVLSVFADQGIKDEVAGTALAIVLRDLSTQALSNADAFRKHGVAVFDDAGKMRHTGLVVKDLENRLQGLSDKAKKEILLDLGFTDKSMGFTQALIGNSERILQLDADYRKAQGTLDEVADKTMSEMTKATNKMKAGWDEFSGIVIPALGEGFMSVDGRPLEVQIREFNANIKESGPLLEDIGDQFSKIGQTVGFVASSVGELAGAIGRVDAITERATGGLSKLSEKFNPMANVMGAVDQLTRARDSVETAITEYLGAADDGASIRMLTGGRDVDRDQSFFSFVSEVLFGSEEIKAATATAGDSITDLGESSRVAATGQDDMSSSSRGASDAMGDASDKARALTEAIIADEQAHDKLFEKLTTFKSQLQEQVDLFGLTGHAAEMARLQKAGATDDEIADHQRLIDSLNEKTEAQREASESEREMEALSRKVQSSLDSIKTPEMRFDDRLKELTSWLISGEITPEENTQLVQLAYEEMSVKLDTSDEAKLNTDIEDYTKELEKQIATVGMSADEVKRWELAERGATSAELERIKALQAEAAAMNGLTSAMQTNFDAQEVGERSTMEGLAKARQKALSDRFSEIGVVDSSAIAGKETGGTDAAKSLSSGFTYDATGESISAAFREFRDGLAIPFDVTTDTIDGIPIPSSTADDAIKSLVDTLLRETQEGRVGVQSATHAQPANQSTIPAIQSTPPAIPQPMVAQPSESVAELKKQTEFQKAIAKNTAKPLVLNIDEVTL